MAQKILVVDDDQDLGFMIRSVLEKAGYDFRADVWERELKPDLGKAVRLQLFKGNEYAFWLGTANPDCELDVAVYDDKNQPVHMERKADKHSVSVRVNPPRTGTYTVRAGCLRKQMALYEKHGLAIQKKYFGEPLAWLVAETGDVNSYVHIWVYQDAEDRNRRRAAMYADRDWQAYIEKNAEHGYLISQESKLMSPASFAPLRR